MQLYDVGMASMHTMDSAALAALANQGKRERAELRNEKDTEILDKMMPVEDLKKLIRQSYEDVLACEWALNPANADDCGELAQGANWLKAAAVSVAGPNFVGKQAGRPGEWNDVKKEDVQTPCLTS